MFSIKSKMNRLEIPGVAIYAGLDFTDFQYVGPRGLNPPPNAGAYAFNAPVIRLRAETNAIELYMAAGGKITGFSPQSYFDAGVNAGYALTLIDRPNFLISVPFQIGTGITTVTNSNLFSGTQFQQGHAFFRLGGYVHVRLNREIRLLARALPGTGITFSQGGNLGGNIQSLKGEARVFWDRVFGDIGLSMGYDYNYREYDITDPLFDYKLNSHGVLVGVTF